MGLLWLLPLILYQPDKPKIGDVWATVLDVGQGLSVVVQTHSHLLVYDAGPRLGESLDAGENVVVPFLRTLAAKKIDMLVISHGDNDHIGGAPALIKSFPVTAIKTSVPSQIPSTMTSYCMAGFSWQWDGVRFQFIYPFADTLGFGNDSCCVLRVDNGKHSILLPGDIEKYSEEMLLKRSPQLLQSTVIIAPHHGSKTSDLEGFIEAVHPTYIVYATGYLNRYHFPHQSVVEKYAAINTEQLNTVDTGALTVSLRGAEGDVAIHKAGLLHNTRNDEL